jgi:hypothetical protein
MNTSSTQERRGYRVALHSVVRFLRRNVWSIWLGGSLTALGMPWYEWRFWVVIVPVAFLSVMKSNAPGHLRDRSAAEGT